MQWLFERGDTRTSQLILAALAKQEAKHMKAVTPIVFKVTDGSRIYSVTSKQSADKLVTKLIERSGRNHWVIYSSVQSGAMFTVIK